MKSSQTNRPLTWTGRILLVALAICGIAQNHARGNQSAIPQSSLGAHCDAGISRHSLHAASLNETAEVSAPEKAASRTAPDGMVWIPGGRFSMGTDHMEDAQPVHEVEVKG